MIRISIIEDNKDYALTLQDFFLGSDDFKVISSYENAEDALEDITVNVPQIILMDIGLPGISGITATEKIKKLIPEVLIIMLTVHDERNIIYDALSAGAIGYITKATTKYNLINSLKEAFYGGSPMTSSIARKLIESFHLAKTSPLTPRETEVLKELSKGKTYQRIADQLCVSKDTVKSHIRHIYEKLHVNSREGAIEQAQTMNLI